jgi:hypothetical protein
MDFLWLIVVAVVVWVISRSYRSHPPVNNVVVDTKISDVIDEDTVFAIQNEFEEDIEKVNLPDHIGRVALYTYKNLMRPWFNKLSGQYRYEAQKINSLRGDWIDYMRSLEKGSTYNFLSLESETEDRRKHYSDLCMTASRKALAIEDAFAESLGKDAVKELQSIKTMDFSKFDRYGNLAPGGKKFNLKGDLVDCLQ